MHAIRYQLRSPQENLDALCEMFDHAAIQRVVLYATAGHPQPAAQPVPVVAALAQIEIPYMPPQYLVFDGELLSAEPRERFLALKKLLDVAQESPRAYFCPHTLPLTHHIEPADAARTMLTLAQRSGTVQFDTLSRPVYVELLGRGGRNPQADSGTTAKAHALP